jgi:hypothetical protein
VCSAVNLRSTGGIASVLAVVSKLKLFRAKQNANELPEYTLVM